MKRETYYSVDFEQFGELCTRHFARSRAAFQFARNCGDPEWCVTRHTFLGVGMRKGRNRRAWKKSHTTYVYSVGLKVDGGNVRGRPLSELMRRYQHS